MLGMLHVSVIISFYNIQAEFHRLIPASLVRGEERVHAYQLSPVNTTFSLCTRHMTMGVRAMMTSQFTNL